MLALPVILMYLVPLRIVLSPLLLCLWARSSGTWPEGWALVAGQDLWTEHSSGRRPLHRPLPQRPWADHAWWCQPTEVETGRVDALVFLATNWAKVHLVDVEALKGFQALRMDGWVGGCDFTTEQNTNRTTMRSEPRQRRRSKR